jgi:hypothetical protein
MGEIYDFHWVAIEGQRYFPLLMFSEQFLTDEKSIKGIGRILAPTKEDSFTEVGMATASDFFEDKGQAVTEGAFGTVSAEDQVAEKPMKKSRVPESKKRDAKRKKA